MTPQSSFMVLAPIVPAREAKLRDLLDSMNEAPGRVNASNALIPFKQFDRLHFARLLILNDQTTGDARVYGSTPQTYPLYLAFLGDIDGETGSFLEELARQAPTGLRTIFSCCDGFSQDTDLDRWMKEHQAPPIANYVNWRGRTVRRAEEEAKLQDALQGYLRNNAPALADLPPREIHKTCSSSSISKSWPAGSRFYRRNPRRLGGRSRMLFIWWECRCSFSSRCR